MLAHKASGTDSFTLWPRCMGYPCNQVLNLLPGIHTVENDKHKQTCDICSTAKHTRHVFNVNHNKTIEPFD